jgi:hypothetical protein
MVSCMKAPMRCIRSGLAGRCHIIEASGLSTDGYGDDDAVVIATVASTGGWLEISGQGGTG